eukprot:jgi/Chrzof1/9986/Cz04g23020.t1
MLVNCSPAAENIAETKCSLDFASRARKVELGQARRNIEVNVADGFNSDSGNGRASSPAAGPSSGTSMAVPIPPMGSPAGTPRSGGARPATPVDSSSKGVARRPGQSGLGAGLKKEYSSPNLQS